MKSILAAVVVGLVVMALWWWLEPSAVVTLPPVPETPRSAGLAAAVPSEAPPVIHGAASEPIDASVVTEAEVDDDGYTGPVNKVSDEEIQQTLALNAAFARANVGRFCELAERLASDPLFKPLQGSRDATRDLTRLFGVTEEERRVRLPIEVRQSLMAGTGLELTAEQLSQIDFGWMRHMRDFDRITGQMEGPMAWGDVVYSPASKFPYYFVRLRILRAAKVHDWEDAARDIEAFAGLLHSTSSPHAEAEAARVMELELETIALLRENGAAVPSLPLPSIEKVRLHAALGHDAFRFVAPGVDVAVQQQAFDCAKRAGFECATALESVAMSNNLRRVIETTPPAFDRSRCNEYRFKVLGRTVDYWGAAGENARLREGSPLFGELR